MSEAFRNADLPPKIAIVQSLLEAMTGNVAVDATVILSATRGQAGAPPEGSEVARKIPSLVLAGRSLEALAMCHAALRAADGNFSSGALKPIIAELRKVLERELLTSNDVDLVWPGRRTHLLPRRSVLIGRPAEGKAVDVAVNCRWFSRGDRNLSLFCDGPGWFVEDLGSTNGHSIQGKALHPGHPVALPIGETRVDIGVAKNKPALAAVGLHRPAKDPSAVVVTLSGTVSSNAEPHPWPTVAADLARRWVVFREQIGVSAMEDSAIRLDSGPPGILAAIRYQSGFWIVPSQQGTLHLDEIAFRESVPLPASASLSLSGSKLHTEMQKPAPAVATEHNEFAA